MENYISEHVIKDNISQCKYIVIDFLFEWSKLNYTSSFFVAPLNSISNLRQSWFWGSQYAKFRNFTEMIFPGYIFFNFCLLQHLFSLPLFSFVQTNFNTFISFLCTIQFSTIEKNKYTNTLFLFVPIKFRKVTNLFYYKIIYEIICVV